MSFDLSQLPPLGWRPFFSQQLSFEQLEQTTPARVIEVGRDHYHVHNGSGVSTVTLSGRFRHQHPDVETWPTVGDWVLLDGSGQQITDCLQRHSLLERAAVGEASGAQAIAANVDLLLVLSSLNNEFNLHRIERYLLVATQAEIPALVILTKRDLCDDPEPMLESVRQRLHGEGEVIAINGLADDVRQQLAHWLVPGTTIALLGSSGVGKSTLLNNLAGHSTQATGGIRNDDKGRHTTTARTLFQLDGELCVIDVPGLREIGIAPHAGGVDSHYSTIAGLASQCRFVDCEHEAEPGCAVRRAVESGEISDDEWQHYLKLRAEERRNVARHEQHRIERNFGKMVRDVSKLKRDRLGK